MDSAATRARHTVKSVGNAPHTMLEGLVRLFFPRIAVSATDLNGKFAQLIDERNRAGQFRSQRHSLNDVVVFEQRSVSFARWHSNQSGALGSNFRFCKERPLHVDP